MKNPMKKLIRSVIMAGAVSLALVTTSTPARAVTGAEVQQILSAAKAAYDAYQTFAGGGISVQTATTQILNAIASAKNEILARIDAVVAADARACAQDAVLDFEIFNLLTLDNQQAFARDARSCVNMIDSHLARTDIDKAAVDQIGFALQAVGPIALISSSRMGFPNTAYFPVLRRATQAVITKLTPTCTSRILEGRTQWTCTVYGDHRGGPEPSRSLAERTSTSRTSRPVAQAVLPTLNAL